MPKFSQSSKDKLNTCHKDLQTIFNNELREKINELVRVVNGPPQYMVFEEGEQQWRIGVRGGKYVRDKTLTTTGFAGTEDVDWENTLEDA